MRAREAARARDPLWSAALNRRYLAERGWPCPTGDEMRRIDRDAIEVRGLPGRLLMETAGRAVATAVRRRFPAARRPLVVCGRGNNGGDGYVVARALREWDDRIRPVVLALGDAAGHSDEARANLELLVSGAVDVVLSRDPKEVESLLRQADLAIDAVFGVGLTRAPEGASADVIGVLAGAACPVVAVDLPSGVSSETGAAPGVWAPADLIVTLGLPKLGLAAHPFEAEILVADLGLPAASLDSVGPRQHLLTPEAAAGRLPARPPAAHKGTFGHVLIVAGSEGKTGAAALACEGALRAGAGLVTAAAPRTLNPIFELKLTEAMSLPCDDEGAGRFGAASLAQLRSAADERDVLVLGPGLGTADETVRAVEQLIGGLRRPAVIDADGLNAFAGRAGSLRGPGPRVLTPHPGEMARLLDRPSAAVQADRVGAARELAGLTGGVVALKGARTVVANPEGEVYVNPTGGPGLATGGTGDVLAGVIGGLLAQGLQPLDAAALGAYVHGRAGERAGPVAVAGGVAAAIPAVLGELAAARAGRDGVDDLLLAFP